MSRLQPRASYTEHRIFLARPLINGISNFFPVQSSLIRVLPVLPWESFTGFLYATTLRRALF